MIFCDIWPVMHCYQPETEWVAKRGSVLHFCASKALVTIISYEGHGAGFFRVDSVCEYHHRHRYPEDEIYSKEQNISQVL
jgi:hypothetical protein